MNYTEYITIRMRGNSPSRAGLFNRNMLADLVSAGVNLEATAYGWDL